MCGVCYGWVVEGKVGLLECEFDNKVRDIVFRLGKYLIGFLLRRVGLF